ncbi:MAG: dihydroneopterin aldolase [Flavobacteriales bacterium]|nr:dihydroneopterin aldolase [Flavobacteriales bacterium]
MGKVTVERVRNFEYHGCMPVEEKVGTWFETTVSVEGDLSKAAASDNIHDAINYVDLTDIVNEQMAIRSNLIEHVAQRIIDTIRAKYPELTSIAVSVKKLNAPVKGEVGSVGVEMEWIKS